jgi:hypothetical protein
MRANGWITAAERGCLTILFVWLAWLPLPFGSNIAAARLPLIAVPLFLCTIAAALRLYATRDRTNTAQPTRAWLFWGTGALLFLGICALQLVPLPSALHRLLSPDSHAIWTAATSVVSLVHETKPRAFPLTVDPRATTLELYRLFAIFAAFTTSALLVRNHTRRVVLASVLCATAIFESLYGLREAALQRYEIWGWVNRLIFNRVTGTFVNPNHFAHYVAIILPLALFLGAVAWHLSGRSEVPLGRRIVQLVERHILMVSFAAITVIACMAAILLAQSRGALLALGCGLLAVAAMLPGRRMLRIACSAGAALLLVVSLIAFLGPERTARRFVPDRVTLIGRRLGVGAAVALWQRFPVFGTGAGTFERVVSMEQGPDEHIYHHAHNDYIELAATTGAAGFLTAIVALFAGAGALIRQTFGPNAHELTWRRRAFQAAALASLTIAMVHALFDFNFFIPANPATLATILGAAVASIDHDRRMRR